MTLPRASKKSTSTTPSIAATRQGAQQSRRQIIDEAEELDDSGEANSAGDDEDSGHEGTEASQNTSDGPLEHLMAKMVEDVCLDEFSNYTLSSSCSYQWPKVASS
jgi:hypothetical protein